jgi:hypothetical protein
METQLKEFELPSGAKLKLNIAPHADAKELYQAVLAEMQSARLKFDFAEEQANLLKDVLCIGFSSKRIDAAVLQCLKRCTYNDARIDGNTFEPEDARQDYIKVLSLVTWENIAPFMKGLFAEFNVFKLVVGALNRK